MKNNINEFDNINKFTKFVSWILVLGPIMRVYASPIPGINFFELFSAAAVLIAFLNNPRRGVKSNTMIKCFITCVVMTMFSTTIGFVSGWAISFKDILIRACRWGYYCFLISFFIDNINYDYAVKWYLRIAIIVSVLLFVQLIAYYAFNKVYYFKIPGLKLSGQTIDVERYMKNDKRVFRAFSVFLEPSHFSYYVLPALGLALFGKKEEIRIALLLSAALIYSSSSSAIVLCAVVWMYYFLLKNNINNIFNFKTIMLIAVFVIIVIYGKNIPFLKYGIEKVFNNNTVVKSARTSGHNEIIEMLSFLQKTIGVGLGNEDYFFRNTFLRRIIYMNAIGYIITNVGYIGLTIIAVLMLGLFIRTDKYNRIFIILFILTNFFSAMMFSSNIIMFLIWPIYAYQMRKLKHSDGDIIQ